MESNHPIKNIAISGDISSGKSTLARNLSAKLGWRYYSGGEFIREWFKKHKLDVNNANLVPEKVDRELDSGYKEMMDKEQKVIFESHLAGWLAQDLPHTFTILCSADYTTRMERASKRDKVSLEEAKRNAQQRSGLLAAKFNRLYGVENSFDPKYFDLIVDTAKMSKEETLNCVLSELAKRGVVID